MVLIEKPPGLGFRIGEAIVALDYQPHPVVENSNEGDEFRTPLPDAPKGTWKGVERLAAAAGSTVKIWSFTVLNTPLNDALWDGKIGTKDSDNVTGSVFCQSTPLEEDDNHAKRSPLKGSTPLDSDNYYSAISNGITPPAPSSAEGLQSLDDSALQSAITNGTSDDADAALSSPSSRCSSVEPSSSRVSRSPSPQRDEEGDGSPPLVTAPSLCRCRSRCVALLREHAPNYVVALRWSPTGACLHAVYLRL